MEKDDKRSKLAPESIALRVGSQGSVTAMGRMASMVFDLYPLPCQDPRQMKTQRLTIMDHSLCKNWPHIWRHQLVLCA